MERQGCAICFLLTSSANFVKTVLMELQEKGIFLQIKLIDLFLVSRSVWWTLYFCKHLIFVQSLNQLFYVKMRYLKWVTNIYMIESSL